MFVDFDCDTILNITILAACAALAEKFGLGRWRAANFCNAKLMVCRGFSSHIPQKLVKNLSKPYINISVGSRERGIGEIIGRCRSGNVCGLTGNCVNLRPKKRSAEGWPMPPGSKCVLDAG